MRSANTKTNIPPRRLFQRVVKGESVLHLADSCGNSVIVAGVTQG